MSWGGIVFFSLFNVAAFMGRAGSAELTIGICKIPNGWADQDSVIVRSDNGDTREMPASEYSDQGYQPPIEDLPFCPRGLKASKREPHGGRAGNRQPHY